MPTPRRFTLLDAMIAVGAVALAIAATQWKYGGYAWFWNLHREGWTPGATLRRLVTAAAFALPALFAATAAVVLARLAPPRPRPRRVALQPGPAACVAALLVVAVETVAYVIRGGYVETRARNDPPDTLGLFNEILIRSAYAVAYAVLATWAFLLLSRRGRPERSWIDRAGRALAVAWILTAFLFWLDRYFLKGDIPALGGLH